MRKIPRLAQIEQRFSRNFACGGAFAVGLQADGKIVAAGHQQGAFGGQIAVARYVVAGCGYAITNSTVLVPRVTVDANLFVLADPGCSWTAVPGADWVTVVTGSPGVGNGNVVINVALNTTTQSRSTTVTVGGKVVNIVQDP